MINDWLHTENCQSIKPVHNLNMAKEVEEDQKVPCQVQLP